MLGFLLAWLLASGPSLELRVSAGTHAPVTIRYTIRVDPAETCRFIRVTLFDEDGGVVTMSDIDTDRGRRLYQKEWVDLDVGGELTVRAQAWWDDMTTRTADRKVLVLP